MALGSGPSRSSAHRNAASVLPLPVGALSSTCSPVAIAGHAWAWAGVGSANAAENQSRTRGEKAARGSTPTAYGASGAAILHVSDMSDRPRTARALYEAAGRAPAASPP